MRAPPPHRSQGSHVGVAALVAVFAIVAVASCLGLAAPRAALAAPPDEGGAADEGDEGDDPGVGDDDDGDGDDGDVGEDAVELAAAMTPGDLPVFDLRPYADSEPQLADILRHAKAGRAAAVLRAWATLRTHADAELRGAAGWLAFRAATRAGREQDARAVLPALAAGGPLANRARVELGRLALARGEVRVATAAFAAVDASYPEAAVVGLQRAALHLDAAELNDADAALSALVSSELPRRQRAQLHLLRGDLHRRRGHAEAALAAYRAAWRVDGGTPSEQAQERLVALGHAPSPLAQVLQRVRNHRFVSAATGRDRGARRLALAELDRVAASVPGLADFAHGALAARDRGRRDEALELLARSLEAGDDAVAAHAGLIRGDLLGKLGRDDEAIATLEAALLRCPDSLTQGRIRWRLHRLYAFVGRGLDAERLLNELIAMGQGSRYHLLALWSLAWRRYELGDLAEAEHLLARLERLAGGAQTGSRQPWRAKAGYWLGRILATRLALDAARSRYADVARRWPMSYYGLLAADRLAELDPELAARMAGSPPPSAADAPTLQVQDVRLARVGVMAEVAIFVRLGENALARASLRARLRRGLPAGAVQLLAALYAADGHDRSALAVLQRYVRRAGPPSAATLTLWRAAFPTPWSRAFAAAAGDSGVPRSVLYAIARTESAFNPRARSHAGAVGLTQLLPKVAARVATLWQLRAPSRRGLLRPETNVAIGARYLAELSRMYRGNHALVAAAYNAGPYAIKRWLGAGEPVATDVFVESLPSGGARAYAMSILSTAATYAFLYPDWQEAAAIRLGRPLMVPSSLGPFMTGKRIAQAGALPPHLAPMPVRTSLVAPSAPTAAAVAPSRAGSRCATRALAGSGGCPGEAAWFQAISPDRSATPRS